MRVSTERPVHIKSWPSQSLPAAAGKTPAPGVPRAPARACALMEHSGGCSESSFERSLHSEAIKGGYVLPATFPSLVSLAVAAVGVTTRGADFRETARVPGGAVLSVSDSSCPLTGSCCGSARLSV